ncbi:MAG: Competence protein PilM [Parcubacteria group bacterium GW2011_GWA2_47_26]|nr:MAG: Competence protein PilM [Parcubacteria group bacterium GW2011_GWA2_47_26]
MSALFRSKTKSYLGIDLGAGGIKVVELRAMDGKGNLITYGFSDRAPDEIGTDYLDNAEETGGLLQKICKAARTTTLQAVTALPIPAVFSAVLSIGAVPKKELPAAVQWEAKKLIPLPLEEVVLDWRILSKEEGGKAAAKTEGQEEPAKEKTMEVLLTAAPKSIIEKYVVIAKMAGLTLASLETESFALIRALLGSDPTPTILLDIGALRSNILIIDRGIPFLTRSLEIGGKRCTEVVAASLQVSLDRAEEIKRDLSSTPLPGTTPGELPAVFEDIFAPLINEIKYSVNVYRTRNTVARMPERIIFTGGGSTLPGLTEFFESKFNIRAFRGNPWERVQYHQDLVPLLQDLGPKFSVAIGLALRNLSH